ncbi:hypothetical protein FE633_04875 [Streptomyces montanus]|uniref:A-factor biosynthesis hotdog domain-containing protein n=1 Tax=Streptomyces montanus TaxID=2580423 RepID=A0A5R9FXC9_9ACTN|nr:AfsA-related hotdog domain-containing protein [Streptomyces montanus]TLS47359.1 hypothetical protein FE633_04875 [Streptomyces montanus]
MTTQTAEKSAVPEIRDIDYGRTVERSLAHRSAISEVFVTDVRTLRPMAVTAGIHLPLTHLYYSDHTQRPKLHDPLLFLEAGRQVSIVGSHVHVGIPIETVAIVNTFQFAMRNLHALEIGADFGPPRIDTDFFGAPARHSRRFRKGRLVQRIFMGDVHVGDHSMDVLFLKKHENEILRHAQRGTPAPLSSEFGEHAGLPATGRVDPELVGRDNPLNVVLAEPVVTDESVTALVVPRFDNPALFDHAYDHLPAMTLVEAARQAAVFSAGAAGRPAGRPPLPMYAAGYEAEFYRFAELDVPLTVTADRVAPGAARHTIRLRFRQGPEEIAALTVTVVDTSRMPDREESP